MKISRKRIKIIYLINLIIIMIMAIIWLANKLIFSEDKEFEALIFQMIVLSTASGLGAIFLIYLSFIYKPSTLAGKIWLLLGLGLLGWCIGEILYSYYDIFTEIPPFPSLADIFYLIAYLPLALGLILQTRLLKIKLDFREKVIISITYIIICFIVLLSVVILPILEIYPIPKDEAFEYFISALYPIFDLILIMCIIVVYAKFRTGTINVAWILLLAGILITLVADILFNWVEIVIGQSSLFELYDLLFFIGYVLIYTGALSIISIMTTTFE